MSKCKDLVQCKMIQKWRNISEKIKCRKLSNEYYTRDWTDVIKSEQLGLAYVKQFVPPDEQQILDSEFGKMLVEWTIN